MLPATIPSANALFTRLRRRLGRPAGFPLTPADQATCSPEAARLLRQQTRLDQLFWLLTAGVGGLLLSGWLG